MGRNYLAALKLAFALVCVGLVIIITAHWIGILPGANDSDTRRRHEFVDSVITMTVDDVTQTRWTDLRERLQRVVDNHPDLISIGVRASSGELKTATRQHNVIWNEGRSNADGSNRTKDLFRHPDDELDPIVVSISIQKRRWGQVEFAFLKDRLAGETWFSLPLVRLLIFFTLAGTTIYACFVIRVLGVFKKTQVVPNDVRVALDTLAEGLLLLDGQSRILFANLAFARSVDSSPRRLEGSSVDDLPWQRHVINAEQSGHDADETPLPSETSSPPAIEDAQISKPWSEAIATGRRQSGAMLQLVDQRSETRTFSVNVTPLQSGSRVDPTKGVLVTFRDVTLEQRHRDEQQKMLRLLGDSRDEIEQKNQRLEILATRDSLTGCLNRRAFFEKFDAIWENSQRDGSKLSTLMIDIDHFKSVNDTYGHHIGDEVLRAVSSVLRERHDDEGLVCRYGGEEFCVLLPGVDVESAAQTADQTRIAITKLVFDEPSELKLTASLGVSELRFKADLPQSLINQADACLYVAKREGRNRVIVFNPSMEDESDEPQSDDTPDDQYRLSPVAVGVLTRALSHRDPAVSQASRRAANVALRWTENTLNQKSRYFLEMGMLLHRIDRLAGDNNAGDAPATTNYQVLQQIIDGLDNKEFSTIFRQYIELCSGNNAGPNPTFAPRRCLESEWMFLATIHAKTSGDAGQRILQTIDQAIHIVDSSLIDVLRNDLTPTDDMARGMIQLQQQMSETIATELSGIRAAMNRRDYSLLRRSIENLETFSYQSNFSQIKDVINTIDAPTGGDDTNRLQQVCVDDQWVQAEQILQPLNDICRDVQSNLLAFSMDVSHRPSNHQT